MIRYAVLKFIVFQKLSISGKPLSTIIFDQLFNIWIENSEYYIFPKYDFVIIIHFILLIKKPKAKIKIYFIDIFLMYIRLNKK